MLNKKTIYYILILTISLLLFSCSKTEKETPQAKNGIIDLTEWNFNQDGIASLDGEWEFYWEQLLTPTSFRNEQATKKNFVTIPGLWCKYEIDSQKPGSNGYGTYKLRVNLPEKNKLYTLKFNRMETAYKLWLDSTLISEIGIVGRTKNESKSKWLPQNYTFYADKNYTDIIIQVSNFRHKKGGIAHKIEIGTPKIIANKSFLLIGFEFFLLGALIIMSIYHFGLFIFRSKEKASLFFGLASLMSAIYILVSGELIVVRFLPNIPWEIIVKTNFISNYFRLAFFVFFIGILFKKEFHKYFVYSVLAWAGLMTLLFIFFPARIYSHTLIIFVLGGFSIVVYILISLTIAFFRKKDGAGYSLLGMLIFLITAVNDTLYDYNIINSIYLLSMGMFIFILLQSLMLSMRSARAHKSIEKLTDRLLILDKIKKELLLIPSFDLGKTLLIFINNLEAERGLIVLPWKNNKLFIEVEAKDNKIKYYKKYFLDIKPKDISKQIISYTIIKQTINSEETILINKNNSDKFEEECKYFSINKIKSVLSSPIYENEQLKAIIYLENKNNDFSQKNLEIIKLLSSQTANIIDNATTYKELESLNINLEKIIENRTAEVYHQKEEIEEKNVELDEKIEELKITAEIVESINDELEGQQTEIEKKNKQLLIQNKAIQQQRDKISDKNKEITASIEYAKRIQFALLQSDKTVPFNNYFILYKPKEIISGDFYWIKKFLNYNIIAAADCTGHGVPGAFMSMLGMSLLKEIANKHFRRIHRAELEPDKILNDIRASLIKALKQKNNSTQQKDGMDIALCIIDTDTNKLFFAGAYNPAYIIRDEKIIEIKADKMPIGMYRKGKSANFTNQKFQLLAKDKLYLFSDGYYDQFGGKHNRKFLKKNFKNLLIETANQTMQTQQKILLQKLDEWQNPIETPDKLYKQTDDILIMGVEI